MAFGKKELILTGVAAMAVVCMGGVIGYQAFLVRQVAAAGWLCELGGRHRRI